MSERVFVPTQSLPEDLQKMIGSVQGLATAYNLLDKGLYNHKELAVLKVVLPFIQSLHEDAVKAALAHPDCEKSEVLNNIKYARELAEESKKLEEDDATNLKAAQAVEDAVVRSEKNAAKKTKKIAKKKSVIKVVKREK